MPLLLLLPLLFIALRNWRSRALKSRLTKLGQLPGRSRAAIETALKTKATLIRALPNGGYTAGYVAPRFSFVLIYDSNDICQGITASADSTINPVVGISYEPPPRPDRKGN